MKIVDVPPDAEIKFPGRPEAAKMSFREFLISAMDMYEPAGKGPSNIRKAFKIVSSIEAMDGHLTLEDADFEVLKSAVESASWKPAAARQLVAFFDAMDKVQEVKTPDKK